MTDTENDTRVLRFRRPPFRQYDNEPRWHIAVREYNTHQLYSTVLAECGYEAKGLTAMTVSWSRAKNPPRGPQCRSCIKAMS